MARSSQAGKDWSQIPQRLLGNLEVYISTKLLESRYVPCRHPLFCTV